MNAVLDALHNLGFDWRIALANLFNFLLIFLVLKHFFFGSISKILNERRQKIEKGLADAAAGELALKEADIAKADIINGAHIKSSEIMLNTEAKAKVLAQTLQNDAEISASKLLAAAILKEKALELEQQRELEAKIPALAAKAVEKILLEKMSPSASEKFTDRLLNTV